MKGVVFVEFTEMVEEHFSPEVLDEIIEKTAPKSKGAYTSVGTYPHQEMIALVTELSAGTQIPVPELLLSFGRHLLSRFVTRYPEFFEGVPDAFGFLLTLEDHIHQEVLKLYPEAELPRFDYEQPNDDTLVLSYHSTRPFADLAHGLLEGCIDHWQEKIELRREDLEGPPGTRARFTLTRI